MGEEARRLRRRRRDRAAPGGMALRENAIDDLRRLAIAYMLIPIAVIIVFSFRRPRAATTSLWERLHARSLGDPFAITELMDAMVLSLELGGAHAVVSTAIGTLMAMALVRYKFFGRRAINFLIVICRWRRRRS